MEVQRIEIDIDELDIDEGKSGYIARRGIEEAHVFQVLWNPIFEPHFYRRNDPETGKPEYSMLGQTSNGRYLRVAIEHVEDRRWRLISAYWLRARRGERDYQRE